MNASGESNQMALLSNSSPPDVVPYHPFFTHFSDPLRVLVVLVLMIFGCIANILSLLGLSHARINQVPRGLLIILICVADNLYLTSALVVEMLDTVILTIRPGCAYLYVLLHALRLWSYILVVLFLIDRVCSLKCVKWHRRFSSGFWTRVVVCVSLLFACCVAAFLLVFVHYDPTVDGAKGNLGSCVVLYHQYKSFALYLGIALLGFGEVALELIVLVCTGWIVYCLVIVPVRARNTSKPETPKVENRNGTVDAKYKLKLDIESQQGIELTEKMTKDGTELTETKTKDVSERDSAIEIETTENASDSVCKSNANCDSIDKENAKPNDKSTENETLEEDKDSDTSNTAEAQNDSVTLGNSDAETASLEGRHDTIPRSNIDRESLGEHKDNDSEPNSTESVVKDTDDKEVKEQKSVEAKEEDSKDNSDASVDEEAGKDKTADSKEDQRKGSPDYVIEASVIGAVMVVCCVPQTVSFMYFHVRVPSHFVPHETSSWYPHALIATQTMSLAFHGIKLLLYLCSSRNFRKSLYQLCCSCFDR